MTRSVLQLRLDAALKAAIELAVKKAKQQPSTWIRNVLAKAAGRPDLADSTKMGRPRKDDSDE